MPGLPGFCFVLEREPVMSSEIDYAKIEETCREADLILVGIGEKFQYDWTILQKQERFKQIEADIETQSKSERDQGQYRWIIPFLQRMALEKFPDELLINAYHGLERLISDQNNFIISMSVDDYLYQFDFRHDKLVTPCGGFRKMQCDSNCCGDILDIDDTVYESILAYYKNEISLASLQEPVCAKCGRPVRFNQIGVTSYAEEGYLPQWERYTKWLQGTINRKICVLELGVGMEFPNLIRWPFERIVYYNQKAVLYRFHPALYQVSENLNGRGFGICQNPIDFLSNGFVK